MGSHSINSAFGAVQNASTDGELRSAGGSSGGSAVAVAKGQCWAYVVTKRADLLCTVGLANLVLEQLEQILAVLCDYLPRILVFLASSHRTD